MVATIIALKSARSYVLSLNCILDLQYSALQSLNNLLSKLIFC